MSARLSLGTAIIASALSTASALAQNTQPPTTPPALPGSATTIPEKTPSSPGTAGATGNLSDKLDKSDGVIKPPAGVDPGIAKTTPDVPATMPVIKPMEEKGGPVAK